MKNQSGFSLLELMITIAVIAIVSAISVPNFITWRDNYKLDSASRDVMSVLQNAKIRAVRDNANVEVIFNTGAGTYMAFVDNVVINGVLDAGETTIANGRMLAGVTMTTTFAGDQTAFSGNGLPTNLGTVTLTNQGGRQGQIILSIAGNIRIQIT